MTNWVKQSTSVVISFGPFLDKTDGVTEETGLVSALDHGTTGIKLSKNGGALTIRHATVTATTYDAYGMYRVTLDTTDTNALGTLRVAFNEAATCLPVWQDFMVLPANVYDSFVGGSDKLDVNMAEILGTAVATPATAGVLDVNVKNAGNVAWASGAIVAAAIAADAGEEIAAAVWEEIMTGHATPDSAAVWLQEAGADASDALAYATAIDTKIGTPAVTVSDDIAALPAASADAVWDEARAGHVAAGSFGEGVPVNGGVTVSAIDNNVVTASSLDSGAVNEIADGLLDRTNGIDIGLTPRHALELAAASVLQKLTGAGTGTERVRNFADTADLATVTVDGNGNKSAIIYDFSI